MTGGTNGMKALVTGVNGQIGHDRKFPQRLEPDASPALHLAELRITGKHRIHWQCDSW